jgi:hypothetical protein
MHEGSFQKWWRLYPSTFAKRPVEEEKLEKEKSQILAKIKADSKMEEAQ